ELVSTGKVGMNEINMLIDGLGEAFPDMMAKQAQTYEGLKSTLGDNMDMIKQKLGEGWFALKKMLLLGRISFLESAPVQAFIEKLSAGMKSLADTIIARVNAIKDAFNAWLNTPAAASMLSTLREIGGLAAEIGR